MIVSTCTGPCFEKPRSMAWSSTTPGEVNFPSCTLGSNSRGIRKKKKKMKEVYVVLVIYIYHLCILLILLYLCFCWIFIGIKNGVMSVFLIIIVTVIAVYCKRVPMCSTWLLVMFWKCFKSCSLMLDWGTNTKMIILVVIFMFC